MRAPAPSDIDYVPVGKTRGDPPVEFRLMEEVAVGLRVVRGPQWEWEDQDGGEGTVGTVVATEEGGDALVEWDCGGRYRYKCSQDRFDLRVFDCAQAGKPEEATGVCRRGGLEMHL